MQMLAVSSTEYGCMGIFIVVIEILKELPRQNRMSRQATPFVSFRACEGETRISWEIQSCKRQATPFVSFGACEGETRISQEIQFCKSLRYYVACTYFRGLANISIWATAHLPLP